MSARASPVSSLAATTSWFVEYLKENPFKSFSTATLTFGCLLLAPVFWGIGELPQLDFPTMLPLLGTIAGGGLLLTLFLAAMPMAGGWLARSKPDAPRWRSDWWAVVIYVLPGAGFALALWVCLTWFPGALAAAMTMLALGPMLAAIRIATLLNSMQGRLMVLVEWGALSWNAVIQSLIAAYLLATSIQIVMPESRTVDDFAMPIAVWTAYVSAVTVLAVRMKVSAHIRVMQILAFLVAIALLAGTGGMTSISKAMLKTTGWGNYAAKLFVTDRGCDILNRSTGHVVCKQEKTAGGNLVCPVLVRSRIGTPVFLSVSSFTSAGDWPNRIGELSISLPKEDIIVSQRITELVRSKQPIEGRKGRDPATHLVAQSGEQGRWITSQCGSAPASNVTNTAPLP